MLLLLALPVAVTVAAMHRYLAMVAPTNMLVRHVRAHEPRWRTAGILAVSAVGLLTVMHVLAGAVAGGAPAWLNLAVLLLAWDAIKMVLSAAAVAGRCAVRHVSQNRLSVPGPTVM